MIKYFCILVLWFAFSGAVIGSTVPPTILINSSASNNSVMNTYERFFKKVYPCPITGCWIWGAGCHKNGYGKHGHKNKQYYAHRFSYLIHYGELPTGLKQVIAHKCDNPKCVNPEHLENVSQSKNTKDAWKRGLIKPYNIKPIGQYTLTGELVKVWPSARSAGRDGFAHANTGAVALGKRKSAYGYIWKYIKT